MSTDKLNRITAIASRQPAICPARHVRYSEPNDPASWDAPKLDGLEFANHAEAKKAEALFNRLISERDQLTAALREVVRTCQPVNTVYQWSEDQRWAIRTARALLAKIGGA